MCKISPRNGAVWGTVTGAAFATGQLRRGGPARYNSPHRWAGYQILCPRPITAHFLGSGAVKFYLKIGNNKKTHFEYSLLLVLESEKKNSGMYLALGQISINFFSIFIRGTIYGKNIASGTKSVYLTNKKI